MMSGEHLGAVRLVEDRADIRKQLRAARLFILPPGAQRDHGSTSAVRPQSANRLRDGQQGLADIRRAVAQGWGNRRPCCAQRVHIGGRPSRQRHAERFGLLLCLTGA